MGSYHWSLSIHPKKSEKPLLFHCFQAGDKKTNLNTFLKHTLIIHDY